MFVMKAHTHLHVSSYLFLYLAGYESTLFGYGLTSLTLFSTHTHTHVTWLWCCFAVRQAYIVCRARGGLWFNQYQISAVSLWALILSGSLDWLLTAYAIPLLSPTSPVSSSFVPTLCPLLFSYLSVSPLLHSSTLFPFFLLLLLLFSFPPLPSSFPVIIISVIALPLPGGDVFTAASLSNSLMLDYCCMITATIPWWSLLHFAWQCSTLYEQIKMLYPI